MAVMLSSKALEAAAACSSTEAARPALQTVHVEADGTVTATDGLVLLSIGPCGTSLEDYPALGDGLGEAINGDGVMIPVASALAAAKAAPRKTKLDVLRERVVLVQRGDSACELTSTDLDSIKRESFRAVEGPYPDWRKCTPKGQVTFRIVFDAAILHRFTGALLKLRKGSWNPTAVFEFHGPLGAATVSMKCDDGAQAFGLIMPCLVTNDEATEAK